MRPKREPFYSLFGGRTAMKFVNMSIFFCRPLFYVLSWEKQRNLIVPANEKAPVFFSRTHDEVFRQFI